MRTFLTYVFVIVVSFAYSQNLSDSLILYYPFNGNALDSSGNHLDGITNAGFSEDRFGNPDGAIHFNGIDQYLDFPPNKPELKPPLPLSFAFWVKYDTAAVEYGTVFCTDFDQNNHTGVWGGISMTGVMHFNYGDGTEATGPESRRSKNGTTPIEKDTWYFVIGIIRDAENMSIYLNCVDDGGYYHGYGGDLAYTDCQGTLGRKDSHILFPPYYMKGSVDDFRYWNRALTQTDIDSLCVEMGVDKLHTSGEQGLLVYPNPGTGTLNIDNLPREAARIEVYTISGVLVKSTLPKNTLDLSSLAPGSYLLKVMGKDEKEAGMAKFILK